MFSRETTNRLLAAGMTVVTAISAKEAFDANAQATTMTEAVLGYSFPVLTALMAADYAVTSTRAKAYLHAGEAVIMGGLSAHIGKLAVDTQSLELAFWTAVMTGTTLYMTKKSFKEFQNLPQGGASPSAQAS